MRWCRPFAVAGSGGGRRRVAGSGDASMVHTLSVLANLVAVVAAGVLRSLLHCGLAAASPFRAVAFVVCVDRSVFKTFGTKLGQPKQAHRTHTVFKEALSLCRTCTRTCADVVKVGVQNQPPVVPSGPPPLPLFPLSFPRHAVLQHCPRHDARGRRVPPLGAGLRRGLGEPPGATVHEP